MLSFFKNFRLQRHGLTVLSCIIVVTGAILLTAGCASTGAKVSGNSHFYFVQLTDTHFGERDNTETTRRLVEDINKLPMPIEFVALTGDITGNRLADGFTFTNGLAVLKNLRFPFHMLPGNHDILTNKLNETVNAYTNLVGPLVTEAEYKGVLCIFLYVEPLRDGFTIEGYDPLKELEERLKRNQKKPAIIFHHSPATEDFYNNVMHPGWQEKALQQWVSLISKYNVTALIAGHFHRDEMHYVGNVPLFIGPAVAPYWERTPAFRIYECTNGRITGYSTQYLQRERGKRSDR